MNENSWKDGEGNPLTYEAYCQAWQATFGDAQTGPEYEIALNGQVRMAVMVMMDRETFDLFGLNGQEKKALSLALTRAGVSIPSPRRDIGVQDILPFSELVFDTDYQET